MARQYSFDDSEWNEVEIINGYAVFMGYLMMGVRGLGVLVVTWTTIVLLGGFVSDLGKKEFWCLTGIMLVQTAGVFNFLLKEKLSDMVRSWWGLLFTLSAAAVNNNDEIGSEETAKGLMIILLAAIQGLVIGIILCPLGVVYLLGLYISAGVSFWRLIEHDFGDAGGANQKPALQVLYSLAAAQGVLFGYKAIYGLTSRIHLARFVAELGTVDEELVAEYLEKTVEGCKRDPSFATGRNLVTYGLDLMVDSKSHEGFIAGIRVLGGAIKDTWPRGRKVLAKYLLTTSDSSSHMIQRLLETMGPRCPYSREVREHAARILALVARDIQLEQFPRGIECISSVLDTPEESNQREKQFDRTRNNNGYHKLKDYDRVELLEEYELDYLTYERESPNSPDFSSRSLIDRLVQCLPCKRKTTESERKESRRANKVHGFDGLLVECVNIIHQLAADENNRRIMSNIVLDKIAAVPLKIHRDSHDLCSVSQKSELQMLEKYWVLTEWLVADVKETSSQEQILEEEQPADPSGVGGRSRENIEDEVEEHEEGHLFRSMVGSALGNAVINNIKRTIESIFDCLDCKVMQKNQSIQILLHLSLDMSFIMDSESRARRLAWILPFILLSSDEEQLKYWMVSGFKDRNKNVCDLYRIKSLAREKLSGILREKHELPSEEREREFQLIRLALGDLSSAFADDAEDISIRTHATLIMEGLCVHYDRRHEIAKEVEGILMSAIPKVVKEILTRCASTSGERRAQVTDIEIGGVSQDDLQASRTCQDGYTDNGRLQKALVSLCRDGYMGMFSSFGLKFVEIASKVCEEQGKSFKYFKSLLV